MNSSTMHFVTQVGQTVLFRNIPYRDIPFMIEHTSIEHWYDLIERYIAQPPSDQSRLMFIMAMPCHDEQSALTINTCIAYLRDDQKVVQLLTHFAEKFENYLIQHFGSLPSSSSAGSGY